MNPNEYDVLDFPETFRNELFTVRMAFSVQLNDSSVVIEHNGTLTFTVNGESCVRNIDKSWWN